MAWVKVASPRLSSTHEIELWLDQRAQNIAGNSSTVYYELGIRRISSNAGGYWNNNTSSASLSVNGTAIGVAGFTYDFRSNYYKVLSNGEISVPHNSDGTKTVSISGSVSMNGGNIPSGSTSGSLTLTTIPRTSSFTAPSSYNMGSTFTVDISRASTSFTHRVDVHYGTHRVATGGPYTTSASIVVDHTWLYGLTPTSTSVTLKITLGTYASDGTYIGAVSKNITAINTTRPTFSTITHSETVANLATQFGAYIQSKSRVQLTITGASASTGASISSYKITFDNQVLNASTGTTQTVSGSGTLAAVGTVTDSRGFSVSKTVNISVSAYVPPAITSVKLYRTDSSGVPNDYGTHAKFELGYKVTPLNNKNSVSVKVQAGSNNTNIAQTAYTGTYVVQFAGFDVNLPYNISFVVNDYFGSSVSPQVLPTGAITMMWGRDWISVGTAESKGSGTINARGSVFQNDKRVIDYNSAPDGTNAVVDFNSYWKHGIINFTSSASADSSSNSPKTGAGVLITRTLGDYTDRSISTPWLQSWQTYQSLDGIISTRYMGTGSNGSPVWSAWKTELNTSHIADHVIETGSNSNGTYEKWHSGKLVQKYAVAVPAGASGAWGSMFIKYINGTSWTFPVAFVNNQTVVTGSPEDYSGMIQVDKISTTRATSVYVMRPASWATATTVNLRAEGRWK